MDQFTGYVVVSMRNPATGRYRRFRLHRVIFETFNGPIPSGMTVDHRDRNKLNNALENLRLVTQLGQSRNRSKATNGDSRYHGVSRHHSTGRYYGRLYHGSRTLTTAHFYREIEAARARDLLAIELHGAESVSLNFPEEHGMPGPSAARPLVIEPVVGRKRLPDGALIDVTLRHFIVADGQLHLSLERIGIDDSVDRSALNCVEHDGRLWMSIDDALWWCQRNKRSILNHMPICRLILRIKDKKREANTTAAR